MVSVCLPSDALSQHLLSYLGFSYLGRGVSLHGCSSKAQPLLLTLDEGYLLTAAPPDLERGVSPLGPPVPSQPSHACAATTPWTWVAPLGRRPWPRMWGSFSRPGFSRSIAASTSSSNHTRTTAWSNSMKLSHARGATQDGQGMVESLTECGPLEKGMANHFSILAWRTPWTVWKGKMIVYWKRNSPGQ